MKKNREGLFACIFIGVCVCLFFMTTCSDNVGLGASVDTESPTVVITYPPASSVIKGTFTFAGTCSDDKGVTSASVSVVNTSTSKTWTYTATVSSSGTSWSLIGLNAADDSTSTGYLFPDGTYEISVTASDSAGHSSGTATRSFEIDNSAPVLILSNPLSTGSSTTTSSYGRSIKLAGDISDSHSVSSLTMYLKQATVSGSTTTLGDLITIPVSDFSAMSSDNPLVVAKYYTESEISAESDSDTQETMQSLRDNYIAIYGSDADDSSTSEKTFYCGIQLVDDAKTYTTIGDSGTGTGNTATVYYINNDTFYDELLSDSSEYALNALKIRDVLNGTTTSYTDDQITAIKKILSTSGNYASSTDITTDSSSKFSLNPDNTPKYSLSGYEIGYANNTKADSSTGFRTYSFGTTLYLSLSAGRDKTYVVPSTVSVKLYKLSDYSDTDLSDTDSSGIITLLSAGSWTDEASLTADKSFSFDSSSVAPNVYYRVVVAGEDRDGNSLTATCSSGYGMFVKSNYSKPEIVFNTEDDVTISGSELSTSGYTITGTVTTDTVSLSSLAVSAVSVTNTSTNTAVSGITYASDISYTGGQKYSSGSIITAGSTSYTFTVTLSGSGLIPSDEGKFKYKISLTATDDDSNTVTSTLPFYIDNKKPTMSISSVSPLSDSSYVNGLVSVKASAADNNELASVTYFLYTGTSTDPVSFYPWDSDSGARSATAVSSVSLGAVETPVVYIDTTQFASGTDKVDLRIVFKATDSVSNTQTAEKSVTVDQSTDAPVITLSNASMSLDSEDEIKAAYTSSLSDSTVLTNIFNTTSNNKIVGSVTDDDGIATITVTAIGSSASSSYTSSSPYKKIFSPSGSTSYTFSCTLPAVEDSYTVLISVVDSAGFTSTGYSTSTSGNFMAAVDSGAPVLSITTSSGQYRGANINLAVTGTVTDGSDSVTIKRYATSTASGTALATATITGTVSSTASWTDTIATGTEGAVYYYIAEDKYGQTTVSSFSYNIDQFKPVFTITSLGGTTLSSALSGGSVSLDAQYGIIGNVYSASGTVSDVSGITGNNDSGIAGMYYYIGTSAPTADYDSDGTTVLSYTPATADGWRTCSIVTKDSSSVWTADINLGGTDSTGSSYAENTYVVYFEAVDAAGNVSLVSANPVAKLNLIPDSAAPVIAITTAGSASVSALESYYQSSSLTVSGTVTETHLASDGFSVSASKTVGSSITSVTITPSVVPTDNSNAGLWTITIPAEGVWNITLSQTDKAGRTATKTYSATLDATAPSFNSGSTTYNGTTYYDYINGAAYSTDNWYKSQSLPVTGSWTESVSGIDTVYYQIRSSSATDIMTTSNYSTTGIADGNFVTTDQGTLESFSASVGSFTAGTNYLTLVAVDKAGNAGLMSSRTIKVDLTSPSIDADSTDAVMTNGSSDITITGIAADDASGIASVSVYIGSSTYTISSSATDYGTLTLTQSGSSGSTTYSSTNTKWTLSIDADGTTTADWFTTAKLGSNPGIYATVTDNAGNTTSKVRVASLTIDKTAPVVTVKSPTASSSINGVTDITGTVTETYPASLSLYYYFGTSALSTLTTGSDPTTAWTQFGTISSASSIYTWTFSDMNVTSLASSAGALTDGVATMYILPVAYDEAGNCSVDTEAIDSGDYTTYTVDLNTDRPTIKVTNLSANGGILMYGTDSQITGTVTDDDSTSSEVVAALIGSSSPITSFEKTSSSVYTCTVDGTSGVTFAVSASSGVTTITNATYGTTSYTASSGDWTYTPPSTADGSKTVYFFIQDNDDTSFYTAYTASGATASATASTLYQPYIQFKSNTAVSNSTVIQYTSDSTAPAISSLGSSYGPTSSVGTVVNSLTTTTVLGGTNAAYSKFIISASDANGIAGMSLTVSEAGSTSSYLYNKATASTIGSVTGLTADSSGSFTANSSSAANTWTTGPVALSGTGLITVVATVYDQSGLYSNMTSMFYADNSVPSVSITAPGTTESDWVTSTTTVKGSVTDNGMAGVSSVEWMIPTVTQQSAYSSDSTALDDASWTTLSDTASISIAFDSTVSGASANILTYANSTYAEETETDSEVWNVPYYFRVTDAVGNSAIVTTHYIVVDVDGGRPTAKILYPEDSGTVGGTFSVYGTATDDLSVAEVHVQIDTDGDGDFDATDYTNLSTTSNGWGFGTSLVAGDASTTWYVLATGTNSWKLSVNSSSITTSDATMGIRVVAVDSSGNTRTWASSEGSSYVIVSVDQNIPKVSDLKLVQYSGSVGGTVSKERSYTSGMYISNNVGTGQWYLTGTITDDGKISTVTIDESTGSYYALETTDLTTSATLPVSSSVTFYAKLPSDTTTSGLLYAKFDVTDEENHTFEQYISINLDNTAPSLYTTDGTASTTTTSSLRLVHNSANVGSSNVVENDNYLYTFGDKVKDADSGLSYIAFYFERVGSSVTKVLCPMYDNYTYTTAYAKIGSSSTTDGSIYINTDGLACMYMSGTRIDSSGDSSTTSFKDATYITSDNYNIRKGGLVKIGGMYTKITNVDTTNGIITFEDEVDTSFTTVEVIYAQVVDHLAKESISSSYSYLVDDDTDDGDGMIETLVLSGSTYTWTASIQSDYLTDGPVQIHAVAIDAAGNISSGYITTSVQNNRPRLTKIMLGTDLNGNGTYDYTADTAPTTATSGGTDDGTSYGEFYYYSAIDSSGDAQATVALTSTPTSSSTSYFVAKNGLCLLPEFTGGNTSISYTYMTASSSSAAVMTQSEDSSGTATSYTLNAMTTSTELASVCTATGSSGLSAIESSYGGVVLSDTSLTSLDNGGITQDPVYFAFTFWDQTDETTQGYDSQYALLSMPVIVDVTDNTAPSGSITPFYWNSSSDNSLYDNSTDNGHIELEADWKQTSKYAAYVSDSTIGEEYDLDPKVSGKIRIQGYAYDETLLGSISLSMSGISLNSGTAGASAELASYSSGAWSVESGTVASDGWSFSVEDVSVDQSGHSAKWELDLDTSKLSTTAGTDKVIYVMAADASGNASSSTVTTQTTSSSPQPYYKVDVVPYITEVKTALSSLSANTPTIYSRTALGHYPVSSAKSAYFTGFNIAGGTVYDSASTPDSVALSDADTDTFSGYTCYSASASALVSGAVYISVDGVVTLNNMNDNDALGSYSGSASDDTYGYCYNRLPNSQNNNLLTDDVVLDVWNINSAAAKPISGTIQQPVMSINQYGKYAGVAFVNGPLYFSMGGNGYSYQYWAGGIDFWTSIGFTYDSLGYSYGVTSDGDINSTNVGDLHLYSGRWGVSGTDSTGYYSSTNVRCIDAIGQKDWQSTTTNGTTTYSSYNSVDKERIQSPSMAATVSSSTTNLYLAYYDTINDEIRFKWGQYSGTTASNSGLMYFQYGYGSSSNTRVAQPYSIAYNSIVVGHTTDKITAVTNSTPTTVSTDCGMSGYYPGQYVGIDAETVSSTDIVGLVWYDETNQKLYYMYNKDPVSNIASGEYTHSSTGWSDPVAVFDTGIGEYCKIKFDANGGVHIAAYDSNNCNVDYAYASSYAVSSFSTSVVDSYSVVGSEMNLDVGIDASGNAVPYISYYANNCVRPKIAYKVTTSTTTSSMQGVSSDLYTGNWEVSIIPTSSKVPEDHINVGLWKSSGAINYSTTDGSAPGSSNIGTSYATATGSSYSATNQGMIYGNGTKNPMLGYAIKSGSNGYLETAQMQ